MTDQSGSQPQLMGGANEASAKDRDHSEPITVVDGPTGNHSGADSTDENIPIGTLFDQSLVEYTARLVASRFLLTGCPGRLVANEQVRVSIKNLALLVLGACVRLQPDTLLMPVMLRNFPQSRVEFYQSDSEESADNVTAAENEDGIVAKTPAIRIVDNHFAEDNDTANEANNAAVVQLNKPQTPERNNILLGYEADIVEAPVGVVPQEYSQRIHDVLLYYADADPMLRGNCIAIAESFVRSVLDGGPETDVDAFVRRNLGADEHWMEILSLNGMVGLILEVSWEIYVKICL